MRETKELIEFLDILKRNPAQFFHEVTVDGNNYLVWDDDNWLTEIKEKLESLEDESLCDDCEWFKNPGACPDYDESKCRYNGPMEEEATP